MKFERQGDSLTRKPRLLSGAERNRALSALVFGASPYSVQHSDVLLINLRPVAYAYAFDTGQKDLMDSRKSTKNWVISAKWSAPPNNLIFLPLHHTLLRKSA